MFTDFINDYPTHSNKYRALEFIKECNRKIPYQIMEEGLYFDDIGDSEKALDKYIKARSRVMTNDTLILESIEFFDKNVIKLHTDPNFITTRIMWEEG